MLKFVPGNRIEVNKDGTLTEFHPNGMKTIHNEPQTELKKPDYQIKAKGGKWIKHEF